MRDIKFKYVYSNGNETFSKVFTLQDIERGKAVDYPCGYNIVDRLQFTGVLDKNNDEIYENQNVVIKKDNCFGDIHSTRRIIYVNQSGRFHAEDTQYDNLADFVQDTHGKNCAEVVKDDWDDVPQYSGD